jgi:hypothetical protein
VNTLLHNGIKLGHKFLEKKKKKKKKPNQSISTEIREKRYTEVRRRTYMTAPITVGNVRNLLRPNIFANLVAISVLFVFFLVFDLGGFHFSGF